MDFLRSVLLLIFIIIINVGCESSKLSENEIEIISANFKEELMELAPFFDLKEHKEDFMSTIQKIIEDVDSNNRIKLSRAEVVELATNLVSEESFEKLKHESRLEAKFVKNKLDDFMSGELSIIEEYNFVEKLLLSYYWKNWICNLGNSYRIKIGSIDTILLYENREYKIPISIEIGDSNHKPYGIISNSLQKSDKNEIFIKTGNAQKNVLKKVIEIEGYNVLTGEKQMKKDSIYLKIIKNG